MKEKKKIQKAQCDVNRHTDTSTHPLHTHIGTHDTHTYCTEQRGGGGGGVGSQRRLRCAYSNANTSMLGLKEAGLPPALVHGWVRGGGGKGRGGQR